MLDLSRTTTVLLEGLHDADDAAAWGEFDRRYRPIVVGFARRLGLSDTDAADVAQDTMTRFLEEYRDGRYDRGRGRLRSWLVSMARTRIAMHYRKRDVRGEVAGVSSVVRLDDEAALTRIWDQEQRSRVLKEAMDRLRSTTRTDERTVRAFELLAIDQKRPAEVAAQLEMSAADVYRAKNRVAERLRGILAELESAFEEA